MKKYRITKRDTEHDKLADIVVALEQFDMEEALETFDMAARKEAELYPDIWDYDEEEEEIKDELLHDFEQNETLL